MNGEADGIAEQMPAIAVVNSTPSSWPQRQILVLSLAIALLLLIGATLTTDIIATILYRQQDLWLLCIAIPLTGLTLRPILPAARPLSLTWPAIAALTAAIAVGCYAGHHLLLSGYDLTRDEQMANFDAAIFASGHLVWPLPREWQSHAAELGLRFMPHATPQLAWVSNYLPFNAALRALFGFAGDPALTGPVLTGFSVPLLWGCARRIWPDKPETAVICLLLLVSAGQFIMAGMTAYAMPAHLFFNLLWLWLFLSNRRSTDFVCLAVGFIATGLHQPLFHPMFVAPFVLMLFAGRNWRRVAIFLPGYAAICAFWLLWPQLIQLLVSGPHAMPALHAGYVSRLVDVLVSNRSNLPTMAENLLRFLTWQNVLLMPMLLLSWPVVRRDRFAAALAIGILLPIFTMTVILPSQGYGFGYRYLHPALGNAILLAGYSWNHLENIQAALRSSILRAAALGILVCLPLEAWMTHKIYAPFAEASARIDASGANYALLPEGNLVVFHDLVLNRPDLSNRPIRLIEPLVADPQDLARRICHGRTTVVLFENSFFNAIADALAIPHSQSPGAREALDRQVLARAGCRTEILR